MLQGMIDWLFYTIFSLDQSSRLAQSLNFFMYDSIKILLLIFLMISVIGFLRTYIPQNKVKKWLSKTKGGIGNLFASLFGAITPFCSCSSIPIFLGFLEGGIPLGVSFSFLITSPLINEYVAVIMLGFFGWKVTLFYIMGGILIGTLSGLILGKMRLEKHLVKDLITKTKQKESQYKTIKSRALFGINEATTITKKIWLWVLIGVGIGAIIHNYIPQEIIQGIISKGGIFTVPIAVLLGIPMYGSCAAIVPIAAVLFRKGIPLGTSLAFMMATAALSLPEAIILRRAMKLKLIGIFFGIVGLSIVIIGYLFNIIL